MDTAPADLPVDNSPSDSASSTDSEPELTGPQRYCSAYEIVPRLYLSNAPFAWGVIQPDYTASPEKPKIKYVLSLFGDEDDDEPFETEYLRDHQPVERAKGITREMVFLLIEIDDYSSQNILGKMDQGVGFIESSLSKNDGDVLVHCQGGVSRSPTMIMAYLMKSRKMTMDEAQAHVKSKKLNVSPNAGFKRQLRLWGDLQYTIFDANGEKKSEYVKWSEGQG